MALFPEMVLAENVTIKTCIHVRNHKGEVLIWSPGEDAQCSLPMLLLKVGDALAIDKAAILLQASSALRLQLLRALPLVEEHMAVALLQSSSRYAVAHRLDNSSAYIYLVLKVTVNEEEAGRTGLNLSWVPGGKVLEWQKQVSQKGKYSLNLASKVVLKLGVPSDPVLAALPKVPGSCTRKDITLSCVGQGDVLPLSSGVAAPGSSCGVAITGVKDMEWETVRKGKASNRLS